MATANPAVSPPHVGNGAELGGEKQRRAVPMSAEDTPDGLRYPVGGFTLTITQQRKKWRVVIKRGEDVLGMSVVNLAAVKERRELVRSLGQGVTAKEADTLAKALMNLAITVERDWPGYERRSAEQWLRQYEEQCARAK